MTKKYTAADFANARFAEHEDGRVISRCDPVSDYAWENNNFVFSDEEMANSGWVPVPAKPTITQSELRDKIKSHGESWANGYHAALIDFGGEVIADPEPTNAERLALLIGGGLESNKQYADGLAEYLDDHGVTAPNAKGN